MSNMSGEPTTIFPTYGTQPAGTLPPAPLPPAPMPPAPMPPAAPAGHDVHRGSHRGTMSRPDWLKSELIAYVVAVLGVLLAAAIIGTSADRADHFRAAHAWTLITVLTVGYMVSRGIAKAGNARDRYDENNRY